MSKEVISILSVVEILAASIDVQIEHLTPFLPSVDELALEFDDTYVSLKGQDVLSPASNDACERIDAQLARMSEKAELWDASALDESEWWELRTLAAAALIPLRLEPALPSFTVDTVGLTPPTES